MELKEFENLQDKIIFEKYNGWSNRDTWAAALWLNNDYNNYIKLMNTDISKMDDLELYNYLKKEFYYGDTINFYNVKISEIREKLNL